MKKTALFLSGIFLTSSILFVSQPSYAMGKSDAPTPVKIAKTPNNTSSNIKKPKKQKNPNSKATGGRCKNPSDLDASGKRCGNRAASVKKGGAN